MQLITKVPYPLQGKYATREFLEMDVEGQKRHAPSGLGDPSAILGGECGVRPSVRRPPTRFCTLEHPLLSVLAHVAPFQKLPFFLSSRL